MLYCGVHCSEQADLKELWMKRGKGPVARRDFLQNLALVGGVIGLQGCGEAAQQENLEPSEAEVKSAGSPMASTAETSLLPDGLKQKFFIQHKQNPLSLESLRSAMGRSPLTAIERLFVRNNLPLPSSEIVALADEWILEVSGVVNATSLTLRELKSFPFETVVSVLQCSGNGRGFFEHGPSGSPWKTGAAGCVMWTGVRLSVLLSRLGGVNEEAAFITATGGEVLPAEVERDKVVVERSIPLRKGLKDCLLAWEINGQPIPITHGGPLRFVVPGYFGCNQIKYVKRIAATAEQTSAKIQKTGYRFRPIGEKGDPEQPTMWRMPVKSWINGPGAEGAPVPAGQVTFYGVAFSGERGVTKVEVSLDEGRSWVSARLSEPDLGANAWRGFLFKTQLKPGAYTLYSRATDQAGEVQPRERVPNERGYGHNGWFDHGLQVQVVAKVEPVVASSTESGSAAAPATAQKTVTLSESGQRGKEVFTEGVSPPCGACHTVSDAGTTGVVGPNLDAMSPSQTQVMKAVRNGVGAMPDFSSQLSETQLSDLATYVVEATKK